MENRLLKTGLIILMVLSLAGCTFIFQKGRRSDMEKINELSRQVDVILLAQASMARVVDSLAAGAERVPILASPNTAVDYLATVL